MLTGGHVQELVIVKEQGGHVVSQGGNRFIILSAGYLGSLLWGVVIYVSSVKTDYDKKIMAFLGLSIMTITVCFSNSFFTWLFGFLIGGLMLLSANYLATIYNDFLLRLIGLTNMAYVPMDIYSDTISRAYLPSDAAMLANEFGGSGILWGISWIAISALVILKCLRNSLQQRT